MEISLFHRNDLKKLFDRASTPSLSDKLLVEEKAELNLVDQL